MEIEEKASTSELNGRIMKIIIIYINNLYFLRKVKPSFYIGNIGNVSKEEEKGLMVQYFLGISTWK